jgi:hypothetical protein
MTRQGTRRLHSRCSEQGKLPAAKAFTLAERDKYMSEQKQSFMQQLDAWTTEKVIDPLIYGDPDNMPGSRSEAQLIADVKTAIREKVLESYHNGQGAAPRKAARKEFRR